MVTSTVLKLLLLRQFKIAVYQGMLSMEEDCAEYETDARNVRWCRTEGSRGSILVDCVVL